MTIKEIRQTIEALNWNRQDATGGTREENRRTDLPALLAPHVAAVKALDIHPRFGHDLLSREFALAAAEKVIARWRVNAGILPFEAAEPVAVNLAPVPAIPEHAPVLCW